MMRTRRTLWGFIGSLIAALCVMAGLIVSAAVPTNIQNRFIETGDVVGAMAAADGALYWGNFGEGGNTKWFGKAQLNGCGPVTILNDGLGGTLQPFLLVSDRAPIQLAAHGAKIYWTKYLGGPEPGNTPCIGRANADGTGVEQCWLDTTLGSSPYNPYLRAWGLAVNDTHIYWTDQDGTTQTIYRALLDGSTPPSQRVFIAGGSRPLGVTVDANYIYWANYNSGAIGRANLDGSFPNQAFISGLNLPTSVVVDGAHIYWNNGSNSSIGRADIDGGNPNPTFIPLTAGDGPAKQLALDQTGHIYWTHTEVSSYIGRAVVVDADNDGISDACDTVVTFALGTNASPAAGGTIAGGGTYNSGTVVSVTQSPNAGYAFTGWSGACGGTGACSVTMDAAKSVTANYVNIYGLGTAASPPAGGIVTGGGIYNSGTVVSVTQVPNAGYAFTGWSGACTGTGACSVTMNGPKSVTANYKPVPATADACKKDGWMSHVRADGSPFKNQGACVSYVNNGK